MADWITAIATVVTALGIIITPVLVEWSRRRYETRQEHFKELKQIIFAPLLEDLTNYYIPVLERARGVIEIKRTIVYKSSPSVTEERPYSWENRLGVKPPPSEEMRSVTSAPSMPPSRLQLYEDAKTRHFKDFFKRWERFKQQFEEFAQSCLDYTGNLQKTISQRVQLPEPQEPRQQQAVWADSQALAEFVYRRHLGLINTLQINQGVFPNATLSWPGHGPPEVAMGTVKEIDACRLVTQTLADEDTQAKPLFLKSADLKPTALQLKEEIERLLPTAKLSGNCPFVKA